MRVKFKEAVGNEGKGEVDRERRQPTRDGDEGGCIFPDTVPNKQPARDICFLAFYFLFFFPLQFDFLKSRPLLLPCSAATASSVY